MRSLPLYDAGLLQRAKRPVGAGELGDPRRRGRAENSLCGDEIQLDVRVDGERISGIAHRARGCALVTASASLLAETLPGSRTDVALTQAATLRAWLAGSGPLPAELAALEPLRMFPARSRCVQLPWDALVLAIEAA